MTAGQLLMWGVALFALCVAVPEIVLATSTSLAQKTVSHYLRGKLGYVTDIGFLILGVVLVSTGRSMGWGVAGIAAAAAGFCVILAMLTARCAELLPSIDFAMRAHVVVTGTGLLTAWVMIVAASRNDPALAALGAGAPVVTSLTLAFRTPIAVTEKLALAMVALWLVAFSLTGL